MDIQKEVMDRLMTGEIKKLQPILKEKISEHINQYIKSKSFERNVKDYVLDSLESMFAELDLDGIIGCGFMDKLRHSSMKIAMQQLLKTKKFK